MTPLILGNQAEGDAKQEPVVKIQLSGNIIGAILTLLGMAVGTITYVNTKTDRKDVKEIVDDKIAPMKQMQDQIYMQNQQIIRLLEGQRNVSR